MKECKGCGQLTVNPEEMPRYDVFNPEYNPNDPMDNFGPYDAACFASTATGMTMAN